MNKEKLQNNITKDSKHQAPNNKRKKLQDYTGEELDKMPDEEADQLFVDAIVETLNDPENHDKSN